MNGFGTLVIATVFGTALLTGCTKKEETTTTTETSTTEAPAVVEETSTTTTTEATSATTETPMATETPAMHEACWNSWIQDHDSEKSVKRVIPGSTYDINFDLALLDYSTLTELAAAPTKADPMLTNELKKHQGAKATIYVKPVIGGRGLDFTEGFPNGLQREVIDLTRLRQLPAKWSRTDDLQKISKAAAATQVKLSVTATEPGCASIGLSIWNEARTRPLDHLVRYVRVGGDADDPSCVGQGPKTTPLKGGLLSLLSVRGDREADVALHVFEMAPGGKSESHAVFVRRGGTVLSWRFKRHLSGWVTAQSGLLFRLKKARDDANYGAIAKELTDVLFEGDGAEGDDARKAHRILSDMAVGGVPITVFARLVNVEGDSLFLPLGLIAVEGGRLLDEFTTVTQPLPRESYTAKGQCIGTWNMVLPEKISSVEPKFLEPIAPIPGRISQWSEFEKYLLDKNSAAKGAEGLLLLTHQAEGRLWFDPDSGESIMSDNIKRRFQPGSVAILAACSVGDLAKESSRSLLVSLNELGVDAVVVSPFGLKAPVGARFAFHFAEELLAAKRKHEESSLGDLFREAAGSTRKDTKLGVWREGIHEFVLAGDGGLRLCK